MATTTGTSSTGNITTLDSIYQQLINYQIQVESTPLSRLNTQKSALEVQRGVYSDLKSQLDTLRASAKAMLSSDAFYSLKEGRKVSISDIETGKSVISGSVSSEAVPGSYKITNIVLAKNDRISSDIQEYADQALGKKGTFFIGGIAERLATKTSETASTVTDFSTSNVEVGQKELGTGSYSIETKQSTGGVWQFRIVDSEGNAVKVKQGTTDTYTDSWQSISAAGTNYSTGRGLSVNFGADPLQYIAATKNTGAGSVSYQAQGASIAVTEDMSLTDIAGAINKGTYGSGNEVSATVVNRQLIISTNQTGLNHRLIASGSVLESIGVLSGSAFKNILQSAGNASFKVNDIAITRQQNSSLTDVINGVTLNLSSDGDGKSATINISADNSGAKSSINAFISGFNTVQNYLKGKLAVTKQTDGTYARGSLSGDQTVSSLKNDLIQNFVKVDSAGGIYKSMREIGLDVNDSGNISITDSTKLDTALNSNYAAVTSLFDRVMSSITTKLDRYTGTTSYVDQMIKANDSQTKSVTDQITSWNSRLAQRKVYLTNQYAEVQAQMTLLTYQQQTNTSWISTLKTTA